MVDRGNHQVEVLLPIDEAAGRLFALAAMSRVHEVSEGLESKFSFRRSVYIKYPEQSFGLVCVRKIRIIEHDEDLEDHTEIGADGKSKAADFYFIWQAKSHEFVVFAPNLWYNCGGNEGFQVLTYCIDFNHKNAIRVSITDVRQNMSWAVLDRDSGELLQECKRGEFMFPGLTDAELAEARETIKGFTDAPWSDAYIRFGHLPKNGKSKNYATGEYETGVSCYSADWDIIDGCYRRGSEGLDGAALTYLIKGADIYLVTGREIGKGSDGEPIIEDARIVATLRFDSTKDGYVIKEEPAQKS